MDRILLLRDIRHKSVRLDDKGSGDEMIIAYSFGMIDFLHYGHIRALKKAKADSDIHFFGLVSDEAMDAWQGTRLSEYDERKSVLEQLKCVDEIILQRNFDPMENLKLIHERYPNAKLILYHGDDWNLMPALDYLKSVGGDVVFTEYYTKLSPEKILSRLNTENSVFWRRSNLISTKANTLISLRPLLKTAKIEEILVVSHDKYQADKRRTAEDIRKRFGGARIIVRSSSTSEDCYEQSNAGHFESVLNVDSNDAVQIIEAIDRVYASYVAGDERKNIDSEQVLIQTQTLHVVKSGVIFTRDINENRPYYLINYDENGSTDTVTSGLGGGVTVWIARNMEVHQVSPEWRGLLKAVKEIEEIFSNMILDIEFALDAAGNVVIFQVRPLAANYRFKKTFDDEAFYAVQAQAKSVLRKVGKDFEKGIVHLSDMAFWNPAEIIGSNPHDLDYSLYREIITKKAWNEGIAQMGYKSIQKDLMCRVGNKPYIILERAFRSLIPAELDEELTDKLQYFYLEKLRKNPSAHDKIEFEVVFSCYDYDVESKKLELSENGFLETEIDCLFDALKRLTKTAIASYEEVLRKDLEDLECLDNFTRHIEAENGLKRKDPLVLTGCFKELLTAIKRMGTPQFSRQARFAFISRMHCRTLVDKGYFTEREMENFLRTVHTVASDFETDYELYRAGRMSRESFNEKYGHLRSGTYDIRTPRYDEVIFPADNGKQGTRENEADSSACLDAVKLQKALADIGFEIAVEDYLSFLKKSLEMREYFKFIFTKALSLALNILVMVGEKFSIDRRGLSYLKVADIFAAEYYENGEEIKGFWQTLIDQRREIRKRNGQLVLPELIWTDNDISEVHFLAARPNYITTSTVEGDVVLPDEESGKELKDKIVMLEKADPGYDWIFAQGICGLVTKYGGVASHMAIRCAEFGIAAAIGCGEKIYSDISTAQKIRLDCKKGEIQRI